MVTVLNPNPIPEDINGLWFLVTGKITLMGGMLSCTFKIVLRFSNLFSVYPMQVVPIP